MTTGDTFEMTLGGSVRDISKYLLVIHKWFPQYLENIFAGTLVYGADGSVILSFNGNCVFVPLKN